MAENENKNNNADGVGQTDSVLEKKTADKPKKDAVAKSSSKAKATPKTAPAKKTESKTAPKSTAKIAVKSTDKAANKPSAKPETKPTEAVSNKDIEFKPTVKAVEPIVEVSVAKPESVSPEQDSVPETAAPQTSAPQQDIAPVKTVTPEAVAPTPVVFETDPQVIPPQNIAPQDITLEQSAYQDMAVQEIIPPDADIQPMGGYFEGNPENFAEGEFFPQDGMMPEELPPQFFEGDIQQDIPAKRKRKKVKVIKRLNIEKNQKAIARQRRNKIIGRVLACLCVLVFLGTIAGITAISYKTAEQLWWDNIGEEAGVEFKELFTLFSGVLDSDEEKIVTKGYGSQDLDDFYSNLKRKMFLAQDYDLSIGKIVSSVMSTTGDTDNQEQSSEQTYTTIGVDGYDLQYVYYDACGNQVTSDVKPLADVVVSGSEEGSDSNEEGSSSLTGNAELDQLLQEIKFDFSSLAEYEGERNILEISDRQLAAVINDAFSVLATSFPQLGEIENILGKPLNEVVAIKQVIISGNEIDTDTSLKLTVEVKARDLVANILLQQGLPPIIKLVIPKTIYASVRVYPYDVTKPVEASINRLEETKVNKIVRIVDVILKKSGNDMSISDLLVQVNSKVVEVLDSAQQMLPIAFVPTGSVNLYPIESLMGMLEVEVSEQAFLYMLRDIKLPTGESLGLIMPTPEQVHAATNEFVSEISEKYCLDNSDGKISADNTINDVMDFASSDDAIEAIMLKDMNFSGSYSQQLKVRTSYEALAGMLSDYVKNEELLGDIKADIVKMSYAPTSEILSVDIRINLAQMLGFDDDGVMSSLIKQLVPEYIYVSANICVNSSKNTPTTVEINKTGVQNSQAHLQTLTSLAGKFGMDTSSLTYDEVCQKIDEGLQGGLAQMQEKIGCEIVFTEQCAYLPNLFEVVCGTGLLNEDDSHRIEPQTLYSIMKQAYTYEVAGEDKNKTANADKFIGELEGKYYLQHGKVVDDGEGGLLQSVMQLKSSFGTAIDKSALANDKRNISAIYPNMTAGEFAYLMELNIDTQNMSEILKSAEVLGAKINDDEIALYLQANIYEASASSTQEGQPVEGQPAEEIDLSKYSNLLPQRAYITLIIDATKMAVGDDNCVKVIIDGMADDDMADFFSIVRKLSGKSLTESEIEEKIDVQVKEYMSGVKGIDYKFKDGALVLDNIFNVIASSDMVKAQDESEHVFAAEEIRSLLKDLYGYDYQAVSGGNFVAATNLDNFIDVELYDKYFISDAFRERLKEYERQDTLLDGFAQIGGANFDIANIRLQDTVRESGSTVYGLLSLHNLTDTAGKSQSQIESEVAENFKPKFSREEIAYLLRTHVSQAGDMSFLQEQEVIYADNDDDVMTLTLRGKDNLEDENAKGLMPEYFYINVTIELGSIKADGSRDDMNVYSLDINSVRYTEDGGEGQDLELLLTLVDRIQKNTETGAEPVEEVSLDGIMQDIESNLNEFKNQIHNDVFTVTFLAEGGLAFNQTVYQIALNSVYGASASDVNVADMPEELDFRNGLCKVNNMPDSYEYSDRVFLDFANGNRAADSSKAVAEINGKYALARPLQEGTIAILTVLGDYAKDYATSIDGEKLTSEQNRAMSVEQMRPNIDGEELLLMLESSVGFSADGYQNAVMNALYILDDEMILVYKSPIELDGDSNKYADLLPSEMSIVVSIDVSAIDRESVLCTHIGINDLIESEVDAVQSMMNRVSRKDGGENKTLDDANKECSDNVRNTMKALTDNMQLRYAGDTTVDGVTGGGVLILDSIYEVASQKINDSSVDAAALTAQDIKDTLESLFDGLNVSAYTPPTGISANDSKVTYTMVSSQEQASNIYIDTLNIMTSHSLNIRGVIGDWNIASMIDTDRLCDSLGLDENTQDALKLKQTALIPKQINGDSTFDSIRATFNPLSGREYFLVTFDMDMTAAAGVKMSILPERIDLTVCIDVTSQDISIVFNAMTEEQCDVLSRLVETSRPAGVGGLDISNTDAVKSEILDMEIIKDSYGGYTFSITLGDLLGSGGAVMPISKANQQVSKNQNVVLGMGAMIVDYAYWL